MKPKIEIVVVGDEILSGRTGDTNASYMGGALRASGYDVDFVSVVGDRVDDISHSLRVAAGRSHVVLATGGLGPTSDDMTMEAAARAFGRRLVLDEDVLGRIRDFFRRRGRFMSESNRKQALIPEGAEVITNPVGTAPAVCLEVEEPSPPGSKSVVYLMPGVPREVRVIFDTVVLPRIKESFEPAYFETARVCVYGIGESRVYDAVKHLPGAREAFAFYPRYSGIEIVIRTGEDSPSTASELRDEMVRILGDHVYSTSGESMEEAVARLLVGTGRTLGVAESCTGGLIAHRLTNVPGSSAYMLCGVVAYSNESKVHVLGVDPEKIEKFGAVSAEVAAEMAEGVRRIAGADIGLSTTGIAGPGGGSPEKPVGLLYAGLSTGDGTTTKKLQFSEDRLINKGRMSQAALDILRRRLVPPESRRG